MGIAVLLVNQYRIKFMLGGCLPVRTFLGYLGLCLPLN